MHNAYASLCIIPHAFPRASLCITTQAAEGVATSLDQVSPWPYSCSPCRESPWPYNCSCRLTPQPAHRAGPDRPGQAGQQLRRVRPTGGTAVRPPQTASAALAPPPFGPHTPPPQVLSPRTLSLFYIENTSVHRKVCRRMYNSTSTIMVRRLPTKPCRTRVRDKEWHNGRRAPTQDPSTNIRRLCVGADCKDSGR